MNILISSCYAALVWTVLAVAACGSDPAVTDDDSAATDDGDDDEDDDDDDNGAADEDSTSDGTDSDPASGKDAGKSASKDAGSTKIDAGATSPKDAGGSTSDAGRAPDPGSTGGGLDAGRKDAATPDPGAEVDAGSSVIDEDSSTTDPGVSGAGSCSGSTPHGCYVAASDNPMGCPPQIHEQSAFYPPLEEWEACSSPFYTPCNYIKPTGGEPAHCECDLGLHWLCTY